MTGTLTPVRVSAGHENATRAGSVLKRFRFSDKLWARRAGCVHSTAPVWPSRPGHSPVPPCRETHAQLPGVSHALWFPRELPQVRLSTAPQVKDHPRAMLVPTQKEDSQFRLIRLCSGDTREESWVWALHPRVYGGGEPHMRPEWSWGWLFNPEMKNFMLKYWASSTTPDLHAEMV